MQIAQIGLWEFEMPDGWCHKANETSSSYFENEDGSKGLYVKSVALTEPKPTSRQLAEYIQDVHVRGFTEATTNSWEVVDQRSLTDGPFTKSALDLFDESANYRVLSLVMATAEDAVQVSVHDYWCKDYAKSKNEFLSLEASITRVASAA